MINPDSNGNDNQNVNQNPNQNLNQVPNQVPNQIPNQVPDQNPPPLNLFLPNALILSGAPLRSQLNCSNFKPKYAAKSDKDAEAHLIRMNEWMDNDKFLDQVKVQRFCSTLIGEARLWYKSLRPINADWVGLQNLF